jgi:YD repeat-containing protein
VWVRARGVSGAVQSDGEGEFFFPITRSREYVLTIEKDVDGRITRYVYDLEDILLEYDGNNTLTARYTHGPGIDDPIALERGANTYFYHTDGLGSITEITDSSRQVFSS